MELCVMEQVYLHISYLRVYLLGWDICFCVWKDWVETNGSVREIN